MIQSFSVARLPKIEFGSGKLQDLPKHILQYGRRILLVTGGQSFISSQRWQDLNLLLSRDGISFEHFKVPGEPSPQLVDDAVREFSGRNIEVVVAIGGGSALDAAKAIAGLLRVGNSVMDYLEGVGPELPYEGPSVPFIAVPTTAGTGSEATKNAVLSAQGKDGFKKSFRDEKLVAQVALLDPDLLSTCPADVIAANGMDALTQLVESYVSTKSNIFTDSLVVPALRAVRDSLLILYQSQGQDGQARESMIYSAMISGITLAQVGLGSVHGLASPLGAYYPIPHGVVCGTLLAKATEVNISAMLDREPDNPGLLKYFRISEILCQNRFKEAEQAYTALIAKFWQWTETLRLQKLSQYGITSADLGHIVANSRGSSMKTNPVVLTDEEVKDILLARL